MLRGLQNVTREDGNLRSKIGMLSDGCLEDLGTKEALVEKLTSLKQGKFSGVQAVRTDAEGRFVFRGVKPFRNYTVVVQGRAGPYDGFWIENIPEVHGDVNLNLTDMSPSCNLKASGAD
jgi:hypothetical protein